jgi:hypothetical protein
MQAAFAVRDDVPSAGDRRILFLPLPPIAEAPEHARDEDTGNFTQGHRLDSRQNGPSVRQDRETTETEQRAPGGLVSPRCVPRHPSVVRAALRTAFSAVAAFPFSFSRRRGCLGRTGVHNRIRSRERRPNMAVRLVPMLSPCVLFACACCPRSTTVLPRCRCACLPNGARSVAEGNVEGNRATDRSAASAVQGDYLLSRAKLRLQSSVSALLHASLWPAQPGKS